MGNASSHESRRCGLCLFPLHEAFHSLDEPQVRRLARVPRYRQDPTVGGLDDVPELPPNAASVEFTTEANALPISAERGCGGCKAIWTQVQQQVKDRGLVLGVGDLGKEMILHWMIGDRGKDTKGLTVILWVIRDDKPAQEYFRFLFEHSMPEYPHPAAVPLSKVVKEGNTGSPASLNSISTWLEQCAADHPSCRPPPSQLPDRVLKFSKNKLGRISVRLVEHPDRSEPYAALSHRWGPSTEKCRTVHDNLAEHLDSIAWAKLPRTFREAIEVSIHLGLKYLWIDSLCIIQDSKEDWLVQSAKMCDIYQGAHITIAATNSNDSDDGLFRAVPRFPLDHVDMRRAKMFIRERPVSGGEQGVEGHKDETPLLTRGWVFQERLLSKRVVHFAPREVVFECVRDGNRCDCGHGGNWSVRQAHFETLRNYMDLVGLDQVRNHWQTLVRLFCILDLTYYSDMLPALAGISRQLGTARGEDLGRYIAGLWERTLVSDLVWVVQDGHLRSSLPGSSLLPSWSWASRAGLYTWIRYKLAQEDDLQLVSFRVDLVGKDEYGPVNSAELTMRGYLARGSWAVAAEPGPSGGPRVDFQATRGSSRRCHINVDYNFIDPESEGYIDPETPSLYVMKTGVMSKLHLCLVLRAVEGEDGTRVYKRVGLLDETPVADVDSWFEGSEAATIVFV